MDLKYPMLSAPDVLTKPLPEVVPPISRRPVLRVVFSFPVMLASLLVLLMVLTVRERFNDPDMWWHLKTGEIIWNTHSIPRVDTFSFTTNRHPYVPHEWLSQLTIYGAWKIAGYQGLMFWLCALGSILLIGSYGLAWLYSGNAKVAFLGALIAWLFSTIGLAVRPQLVGYCFLLFELLVIHLGRTRNPRWFFILPAMFAIWVNCHGSFFLGLILLLVTLCCSFLNLQIGLLESRRWERPLRRALGLACAFSIGALFVNPVGIDQLLYPLNTLLKQQVGLKNVSEWQPLEFGDLRAFGLAGIAGFILLLPVLRRSSLHLQELLFLLIATEFAAAHQRMLFVFGILVAPIFSRMLSDSWENYDAGRDLVLANGFLISFSMFGAYTAFPTASSLIRQVEAQSPVKALEFIRNSGFTGNMLNAYEFGGYLIWAAPDHKVFIDGRADVFDWTGVMSEYGMWATLTSDPKRLLDKYQIDFCLIPRQAPMTQVLGLLPGWTKAYSDRLSSVFVRSKSLSTVYEPGKRETKPTP